VTYGQHPPGQQPPAGPPPASGPPPAGGPPYGYAAQRPGVATAAGIMSIVMGSLRVVFALLVLVIVLSFLDELEITLLGGVEDEGLVFGVAIAAIAVVILLGLLQIFGGVSVLRLRGRGLAMTAVILLIVLEALSLGSSVASGATDATSLGSTAGFLILDIITLVLLVRAGPNLRRA
jgi:hypothetical protein